MVSVVEQENVIREGLFDSLLSLSLCEALISEIYWQSHSLFNTLSVPIVMLPKK